MERRFLTDIDFIKNKSSGNIVTLKDSANEPLDNLVIYGKTTQAAEPTLDAPQELKSIGAEPFNVCVTGNNLFKPLYITAQIGKPILKHTYGELESTEYNGEIKFTAPKYKLDSSVNYSTHFANGCFYVPIEETFLKISESGEIYTLIADIVLDGRHNDEISGEPAPEDISFTGTGGGLSTANVVWTGVNSEGKPVGKIVGLFTNKYKKVSGVIDYSQSNRIEIRTAGKSLTFTKIMLLYGDWTNNPPEYEDYKEQVLTVEEKTTQGNASNIAGLPAIPVDSGGNYTDESGQNWVANTVNFEEGEYYRRVWGRHISNTGWYVSEKQLSTDGNITYCQNCTSWKYGGFPNALSNYFPSKVEPTTGQGIWVSDAGDGTIVLNITTSIPSVEELEKFLDAVYVDVYYVSGSILSKKLSDLELEQYKSLKTNYPITNVLNTIDAHMEVEYSADTKNYIDNKLTELVALALEG